MLTEQHLAFNLADEDDYKLTAGVGVSSAVQQFDGAASSLSPPLSLTLFCLCLSVLPPSIPSAFVFALPEASLFHFASFCLHLSPRILSLSSSCPLQLTQAHGLFIRHPAVPSPPKSVLFFCVCCSGPTDSTSRINRARAASSSSSRPKS